MRCNPKKFYIIQRIWNGSIKNFEPNIGLHYQIKGKNNADVNLICSDNVNIGIELYLGGVPHEERKDFEKPKRRETLPYWAILEANVFQKGCVIHVKDSSHEKTLLSLYPRKNLE